MKNKHRNYSASLFLLFVLSACGGGNDAPDTSSCPRWRVGDAMTYLKTTTVNNVSTTSSAHFVVTEHSQSTVILSSGTTARRFEITTDGRYTDGISDLPFCPPPAVGEKDEGLRWLPGPIEGTGEWVHSKYLVTDASIESINVPAREFTAKKVVVKKTTVHNGTTDPVPTLPDATITRYYVGGIGNVKQVEVTPTTNTTITEELAAYSYAP